MDEETEERFAEIQADAITDAERVKCSLECFCEGLVVMRNAIDARIGEVRSDLAARA